ncbi:MULTISPECIES: SRPBCC domain-containing protein [unclassified Actinotalea]|uniref:SRPBCC domain-containing protein n=1 Tax=unclassified Actinotalea TaxID=2638618 RepID=UPI00210333FA|nr:MULTISPECIES: SRPBCC domain-containing protein [unclassified Actinotalea]
MQQSPSIDGRADTAHGEVHLEVALPAATSDVWRALTDGEHTVRWLGRLDGVVAEGVRFDLWHDEHVRSRHAVLQWEPRRLLILTWDFPEERPSRLTVALDEVAPSSTTLTLHHEDLDDAVSYAAGWHRHLEYLHAHLAGDDLPFDDFWTGYDDLVEHYTDRPDRRPRA